jgi:hypothetical protein
MEMLKAKLTYLIFISEKTNKIAVDIAYKTKVKNEFLRRRFIVVFFDIGLLGESTGTFL